jgi:hypothetical protein
MKRKSYFDFSSWPEAPPKTRENAWDPAWREMINGYLTKDI